MPKVNPFRPAGHAPDIPGPVRALPWADSALCAQVDPELFFEQATSRYESTASGERETIAKGICRRCPVMRQCRKYALDNPELQGIWGGLTEKERREWRRRSA